MGSRNGSHDRQPEPGPALPSRSRLVRTVEAIEDPFELLWRDTRPFVRHDDATGIRVRRDLHTHGRGGWRVDTSGGK